MSELSNDLNRQALRSIQALQNALITLLETKSYRKIKITEIAEIANLTRSTFYAHFETKDALLDSIINNVLDEFFEDFYTRDSVTPNPDNDLEINKNFFRIWEKHAELIPLLDSIDFDCLMVERLKYFMLDVSNNVIHKQKSEYTPTYSGYIVNFLSYAYVGFLKQWIHNGMSPSADIMGELLYQLTGPPVLNETRKQFTEKFDAQ